MFEDASDNYMRRVTGKLYNQLHHLFYEDFLARIASDIEKEGSWNFTKTEKEAVIQRILDAYDTRAYPENSFETWHDLESEESEAEFESGSERKDIEKLPKVNGAYDEVSDFDAALKKKIFDQLKKEQTEREQAAQIASTEGAGTSADHENTDNSSSNSESESSDESSDDSSDESSDSDASYSSADAGSDSGSAGSDKDKAGTENNKKEAHGEDNDRDSDSEDDLATGVRSKADPVLARKKLRQWKHDNAEVSWLKDIFSLHKAGLEVSGATEDTSHHSVRRQHVLTLTTLLHLRIIERDWKTAYDVFSTLTKLERVDLRSLWPLGIEILTSLQAESRATGVNANSGRLEQLKIRQFYDWLALFFPIYSFPRVTVAPNHSMVYRSGSKTHTPVYKVSAQWNLLLEKQYTALRDSLGELSLVPPYDSDGVFSYIWILCHLSENADLLFLYNNFGDFDKMTERASTCGDLADDMTLLASKDTMKTRVLSNLSQIPELLDKCDACGFDVPRDIIDEHMRNARTVLSEQPAEESENPKSTTHLAKPIIGYSLQKGKVDFVSSTSQAIPKQFWDRLIEEEEQFQGITNWMSELLDYSNKHSAFCLVCGEDVGRRRAGEMKAHFEGHGINEKNRHKKLAALKDRKMEQMVITYKYAPIVPTSVSLVAPEKPSATAARKPTIRKPRGPYKKKSTAKAAPKKPKSNNARSSEIVAQKSAAQNQERRTEDVSQQELSFVGSNQSNVWKERRVSLAVDDSDVLADPLFHDHATDQKSSTGLDTDYEIRPGSDPNSPYPQYEQGRNDISETDTNAMDIQHSACMVEDDHPISDTHDLSDSEGDIGSSFTENMPQNNIEGSAEVHSEAGPNSSSEVAESPELGGIADSSDVSGKRALPEPAVLQAATEESFANDSNKKGAFGDFAEKNTSGEGMSSISQDDMNVEEENDDFLEDFRTEVSTQTLSEALRLAVAISANSVSEAPWVEEESHVTEVAEAADLTVESELSETRAESKQEKSARKTATTPAKKPAKKVLKRKAADADLDEEIGNQQRGDTVGEVEVDAEFWSIPVAEASESVNGSSGKNSQKKPSKKAKPSEVQSHQRNHETTHPSPEKIAERPPFINTEDKGQYLQAVENGEYEANEDFAINGIDDSMDGQRIARSQKSVSDGFGGFSPDSTMHDRTSARDMSYDISRNFEHFATSTQEALSQSKMPQVLEEASDDDGGGIWHEGFSVDSYPEDTSVNFTRVVVESQAARGAATHQPENSTEMNILDGSGSEADEFLDASDILAPE